MKKYGLIGFPLNHSFSPDYFRKKFNKENIEGCEYNLYPLPAIEDLPRLIATESNLRGLNVTIPYKIAVMKYLDILEGEANTTGAVNCIVINREKELKGYNTDIYGFEKSLEPLLKPVHKKALVLGSGGASLAVTHVLNKMNIPYLVVSRTNGPNHIVYEELTDDLIAGHKLIINTTPIGMTPDTDKAPEINYSMINKDYLFYDLIYNPEKTLFLKNGELMGATIKNGLEMLELQAEKSWEIWNSNE